MATAGIERIMQTDAARATLAAELDVSPEALTLSVDEGAAQIGIVDPMTGDLLGAGDTLADAIVDALATVRGWR